MRKSTSTEISLDEAEQLYQSAMRVKELAPWTWMDETDIFGVQNPDTDELGFVSVMGMAGEHFAIAIYQGAEGLYGFWDLESQDTITNPQQLLEIPQLQASFEDRGLLDKQDRDAIKKIGLKFRGAHAWPMFRSYRPGFLPWFVTAEESRFLTYALAQTLEVAPRVKADPDIIHAQNDEDDESYLVRVQRQQGDRLDWEDQMMRVPPPEPARVPVILDIEVLSQLKRLPQHNLELQIDVLGMPTPIGEKGERPYLPYLLMLADGRSGLIQSFEMMKPEPSLAEMRAKIPMILADGLVQAGGVPREIRVRSDSLLHLLGPLAKSLNVKLKRAEDLPSIDAAMDSMFGWMMNDEF